MLALQTFDGLTDELIIQNLEAECIEVIEDNYLRPFSDDEMDAHKQLYADLSREVSMKEDEIKRITEPLKEELKPIKQHAKEVLENLKDGGEHTHGKLYLIADRENRVVVKYDTKGRVVGTRPFTQKERQLTINAK